MRSLKAFLFCLITSVGLKTLAAGYSEAGQSMFLESSVARLVGIYNFHTTTRIAVHISTPTVTETKGDILLIPDLFTPAGSYKLAQEIMAQSGYRLITFDFPGFGQSESLLRFTSFDQRELIFFLQDTLREVSRVTNSSLTRPLVIMGHGFGALLASKLVNQVEVSRMDQNPYMLVLLNPSFVTDRTSVDELIQFFEKRATLSQEKIADMGQFEKLLQQTMEEQKQKEVGWPSSITRISYQLPFLYSFQDSLSPKKGPAIFKQGDEFISKKLIGPSGIRRFCTGSARDIWKDILNQMSEESPGLMTLNPACQTTRMH